VAFHLKPPPSGSDVPGLVRQVRAQARTALELERKHPHWRVRLAVGDTLAQRFLGDTLVRSGIARGLAPWLADSGASRPLGPLGRVAAGVLAADAYYAELRRARDVA
jgi:hypothetical protein